MSDRDPQWLPGEPRSSKRAIAVHKAGPRLRLTGASRVCFSRLYSVEMTEKVDNVGIVTKESLPFLLSYYDLANRATH
jgi:hypothetical protein